MRSWRIVTNGRAAAAFWPGPLRTSAVDSSGLPASSASSSSVRVVHPAYRRHVGHLLQYLIPSAAADTESVFVSLWEHTRVRRLSPEMASLVEEVAAQDAARAEAVNATAEPPSLSAPPTAPGSTLSHDLVRFINVFVEYLDAETDLEVRLSSRNAVTRLRARAWEAQFGNKIRPTALQRQEFMRVICEIVEQRRVPLVVASRLLRCRWPRTFSLDTGHAQQRFLRESIWAWLSDELAASASTASCSRDAGPTPRDARAILDNCAFAFRDGAQTKETSAEVADRLRHPQAPASPRALVAPLALIAIQDVETVTSPEALIALLWSVHAARVPAPEAFWRPVVQRVLALNHHLGAEEGVGEARAARSPGRTAHRKDHAVGHFFSGLTTRHLYRLLSLLKKERWPVEVSTLHELADLALKNVVFETESLFGTAAQSGRSDHDGVPCATAALSKRDVRKRIRDVADLSVEEFLDLLLISGELGIPFSVSASKVADTLLTPLVPHLDVQQLLALLQVVRQTRCHTTSLIQAAATSVQHRGPDVPYALPLAKTLLRTVLREHASQAEMDLSDFYLYFVRMTVSVASKVRPHELATLTAMLYDMYRRLSSESAVAAAIRAAVDHLCAHVTRLLALQLVTDDDVAKVLECTVVLGMRSDVDTYPHVQTLLAQRKQAAEHLISRQKSDAHAALAADTDTQSVQLVAFWSSQTESQLPQLPRAAVRVYEELIYLFERTVTIRATPTAVDMDRFTQVLDRTGLYGLLVGLDCLGQAHLNAAIDSDLPEDSPLRLVRKKPISNQLPGLLESRVLRAVNRRIHLAKLTPRSSNDAVLHVLGHVHCDAEKIGFLLTVLVRSPSRTVRQQRAVWVYLEELANRFGDNAQLVAIRAHKERALY